MKAKKARISELEFLELCTRIFSYRNNPKDITTFLTAVQPFIDFNPRIISDLTREIFDSKYVPNKEEIALVLYEKGYSLKDISLAYGKSIASISLWVKKDVVLFPRSTQEQQTEVIKFMEQYNKIFTPDIRNLV